MPDFSPISDPDGLLRIHQGRTKTARVLLRQRGRRYEAVSILEVKEQPGETIVLK